MAIALDDAQSIFADVHEDVEYQLNIDTVPDALLRVASFQAFEKLSQPFTYTVEASVHLDAVDEIEEALGRDARFVILRDGEIAHAVHGIVTDVAPDGAFVGKTQTRVVVTLEPHLANLRHRGGFRIFQNMAAHEIVGEIFQAENIACLWHVHGVPPKRPYTTQLDESDLEFVSRLASEEGMHFFFRHDEEASTVIFANAPAGYDTIDGDIPFNETEGAVGEEHVRSIKRARRIRPGAFEHRDYDPLEPGLPLRGYGATKETETPGISHKREIFDYPGRFNDVDSGAALAQRRLDEWRSDAFVVGGTASSLRFSAGRTFTLRHHREEGFQRKWLLTSVALSGSVRGSRHDGSVRASVPWVSFSAVPAESIVRPRRWPKPVSRLQSARVVGPTEGDPYVDEFGRIKVQFFWDREGQFDEKSSCWIRMMTPAAHWDEGFWQAHKVGSEVLVSFIDGDIDRPVVLGAVYNAVDLQPNPLPAQVAKSTWKTKSIPGNQGFNEITQDNTAGAEEIYIHAQRNLREDVRGSRTVSVGGNESTTIHGTRSITVHGHGGAPAVKETVTGKYDLSATEEVRITVGGTSLTMDPHQIVLSAPQVITLQVGGSTITMTTSSISATSSMVGATGGDAMLLLEGDVGLHGTVVDVSGSSSVTISSSGSKLSLDGNATLQGGQAAIQGKGASGVFAINADIKGATVNLNS